MVTVIKTGYINELKSILFILITFTSILVHVKEPVLTTHTRTHFKKKTTVERLNTTKTTTLSRCGTLVLLTC